MSMQPTDRRKPMHDGRTCSGCVHFHERVFNRYQEGIPEHDYRCRRRPPVVLVAGSEYPEIVSLWPETSPGWWCGEWTELDAVPFDDFDEEEDK